MTMTKDDNIGALQSIREGFMWFAQYDLIEALDVAIQELKGEYLLAENAELKKGIVELNMILNAVDQLIASARGDDCLSPEYFKKIRSILNPEEPNDKG